MSSPDYSELRGVSGTAITLRAAIVEDLVIRRLLWFLQARSLEPGGLKRVAREILEKCHHRIGTPSMHRFGMKPGQIYSTDQVRTVRAEFPECVGRDFILRGEVRSYSPMCRPPETDREKAEANRQPTSYHASEFIKACQHSPEDLAGFLTDLCVNPRLTFSQADELDNQRSKYAQRFGDEFPNHRLELQSADLYWFRDIIGALIEYQRQKEDAARQAFVLTNIARKVWETLDFALRSRRMVIIEGWEGRGKSEAVKAWCRIHRGEARYVDLTGVTSKTAVFRAIAKALGIASSYSRTATEMQARIEDVLQRSQLLLAIDEAHFLFNQSQRIYARPELVDWIDTALCNHDVPVALVTTPQFIHCVKRAEVQVSWNWRQFRRRVRRWVQLPQWNADADLVAVAQAVMPGISPAGIKLAVGYAKMSLNGSPSRDISGLGDVAVEAKLQAEEAGRRAITFEDVERAINEHLLPSDTGFAERMAKPQIGRRGRRINGPLTAPQSPISATDEGAGAGDARVILADRNEPRSLDIRSRLRSPQADPEAVTV